MNFSAASGQFLCVLGPNGCGKTTLLRLLAGLSIPTAGAIRHRGRPVSGPDGSRLLMFQQPTLFPWMTVRGNIEFALRARRVARERRRDAVRRCVDLVGLGGFEESYPHQLSGGMQQRAELARALAVGPRLLLMDEPFAALDALTRLVLQDELLRLRASQETTLVMVTHDVPEAVFLAERILVMSRRPGRVKRVVTVDRDGVPPERWRATAAFAGLCGEITASLREELDPQPFR
ncbi:MAG TPA: ABC transporter ATP-binding protein [Candidatus Dormibacteraeota bacterium]|nr:ABC transporter ATP-binding protein [Candidatus Dormibacteraeota bacterium]